MKLKDTVHFQLHKTLFVVFIIFVCFFGSAMITDSSFYDVFSNIDEMFEFIEKLSHPDFAYLPSLFSNDKSDTLKDSTEFTLDDVKVLNIKKLLELHGFVIDFLIMSISLSVNANSRGLVLSATDSYFICTLKSVCTPNL